MEFESVAVVYPAALAKKLLHLLHTGSPEVREFLTNPPGKTWTFGAGGDINLKAYQLDDVITKYVFMFCDQNKHRSLPPELW